MENDTPDWEGIEREVCHKLRLLSATWEETSKDDFVHLLMKRDLYLPTLRKLAEFCACIKEEE